MIRGTVKRVWDFKPNMPKPQIAELTKHKGLRATMLLPRWTALGWGPKSQGFLFWYSEQHGGVPRLLHGTSALEALEDDDVVYRKGRVTKIYAYAHKYPVAQETFKDMVSFHTLLLLEWSHGLHTTICELAWVNAVGGYGGKANWIEDKLEANPKLYQAMNTVPAMIRAWDSSKSELRMYDMPARNKMEFDAFLHKYSNHAGISLEEQRFVDPINYQTGVPKIRLLGPRELVAFMLNYIQRVPGYSEAGLNCQTYTADLFAFLTGQKGILPYTAVQQAVYVQHHHAFLYQPGHIEH